MFDEDYFAVAAPATAELVVQRTKMLWDGAFPRPASVTADEQIFTDLGGRWPDAVFITSDTSTGARSFPIYRTHQLQGSTWRRAAMPRDFHGLVPVYASFAPWQSGATLALQLWSSSPEWETSELDVDPPAPRLVRIDKGQTPQPPALPESATAELIIFTASPAGAISLLGRTGKLHRWTPADNSWKEHITPDLRPHVDARITEDPDGAVTLALCRDDVATVQRLLADTWTPVELPTSGCVTAHAVTPTATWIVQSHIVWRSTTTPPTWQPVALPKITEHKLGHRRLVHSDGWSFVEPPADPPRDGQWTIKPDDLRAVGDALWLGGFYEGGNVALVDHPVAAPLRHTPPTPAAKPVTAKCSTLFLRLTTPPTDTTPPAAVTDLIAREAAADVALVLATDGPARTLGLVWLTPLLDTSSETPTVDPAALTAAKQRLTALGTAITAAWPTTTPELQCWAPSIDMLLSAPPP